MKSLKGHLEIMDRGFGFLRSLENNFSPDTNDTFVPASLIKSHNLPEGGFIEGKGKKQDAGSQNAQLYSVEAINQISFDTFSGFKSLQDQTSINPTQQLIMTQAADDFTGRTLDMFTPIGQRAAGIDHITAQIGKNHHLEAHAPRPLSPITRMWTYLFSWSTNVPRR